MRALPLTLCTFALVAPVHAASRATMHPIPAETTIGFTNPEITANGLGWKRFVHTVTTNGSAHTVPALASWAMMVSGFAGAGVLLRRRSSVRI